MYIIYIRYYILVVQKRQTTFLKIICHNAKIKMALKGHEVKIKVATWWIGTCSNSQRLIRPKTYDDDDDDDDDEYTVKISSS